MSQNKDNSSLAKEFIAMGCGDLLDDLKKSGIINEPTPLEKYYNEIITQDKDTQETKDWVKCLSNENINVLITGETGTGKELFAQLLHGNRKGRFVPVNCGGIPDTLLEAEFFGAEKGSYTGCDKTRQGYFELASEGTLFLDEIGELDRLLQSKLLRVIQSRKVRRIGGSHEYPITCRIVSATNVNEEQLKNNNKIFRQDLYFRLAGVVINLKPLRDRGEDAKLIWKHLMGVDNNYPHDHHHWPGNIRELVNTVETTKLRIKYNKNTP